MFDIEDFIAYLECELTRATKFVSGDYMEEMRAEHPEFETACI